MLAKSELSNKIMNMFFVHDIMNSILLDDFILMIELNIAERIVIYETNCKFYH